MRSLAILIAVVALVACSSPAKRDTAGGGGTATGGAPPDAATAADDDAGAPATGALTRAECEALIDHILAIGVEEQRAIKPPDQVPTADQVAQIRAAMIEEMMDQCLVWDRASFDCIMAATTTEQLNACAGTPPE